jgi:hypothetical protein
MQMGLVAFVNPEHARSVLDAPPVGYEEYARSIRLSSPPPCNRNRTQCSREQDEQARNRTAQR